MNTNKVKKIIKTSASWCAPCRFYAPTFHKVSKYDENDEVIYKVMGNVPESELTKIIDEALKDR